LIQRVRFIGEIGLDFTTRDPVARAAQIRVFTTIIAAARAAGRKTLTIHSRRAAAEVVEIVGPGFPGVIILHWFSGSANVLSRAVGYGYYFSVNPAMTRSSTGQSIIRSVPPDRLLMESDGPFVTIDNAPAKPVDVRLVVAHVAALWNLSLVETERRLDKNFARATA
jgi:TatD DNase family protein